VKELNIAKTIVSKRREKGITQDELAAYIGVSKASVSKWETGQSYPDILFLPQLAAYFKSQWRRPPTMEEFSRLVDDRVREEVLFREGVVMGLDKDDTIVKRRIAQKMQFLSEDVGTQREPGRAELESWFAGHADTFALPGRINFRQIYFSPDRRGDRAHADAETALARLAGQPVDSKIAASVADLSTTDAVVRAGVASAAAVTGCPYDAASQSYVSTTILFPGQGAWIKGSASVTSITLTAYTGS
jgi:transcriptional regulator with XRE-family HTH domain